MKMDQATKLKLIDQRYELKTELEKLVQTMHKNFGPHKMQLIDILDQILHINRELYSTKPTTLEQIKEYLGDYACSGVTNLQILKMYRRGKPMPERPVQKWRQVEGVED